MFLPSSFADPDVFKHETQKQLRLVAIALSTSVSCGQNPAQQTMQCTVHFIDLDSSIQLLGDSGFWDPSRTDLLLLGFHFGVHNYILSSHN